MVQQHETQAFASARETSNQFGILLLPYISGYWSKTLEDCRFKMSMAIHWQSDEGMSSYCMTLENGFVDGSVFNRP